MTRAPWRDAVPFAGVRITGARIAGDVALDNAKLIRAIAIFDSRIEGAIKLRDARTDSAIWLTGSLMVGNFDANGLHDESDLYLHNGLAFRSTVILSGAKIDGDADMSGVDEKLAAYSLHVGRNLAMTGSFKDVILSGAKIDGDVDMSGARVDAKLVAYSLQVGGNLHMESDAQNKASFKDVDLSGAKITGDIFMNGAMFNGTLNTYSLQVGRGLFMDDVYCLNETVMDFANIGGNLDLRGATLPGLDLSGASVAAELDLGGEGSTVWTGQDGEPRVLNLRHTHVGYLADAKYAWPAQGQLHLDGFSFNRLGGPPRGTRWWDSWARLDRDYSPAPYQQLAAALTNAGDRDAANEIRYLGRVRERDTEKGLAYFWSGFLQWVAGFGIGTYTFRALYWVIGISFFGALYLRTRVKGVSDEKHGFIWCFGASLSRLLPVIEINKEFTDFFGDPQRNYFTGSQSFIFSFMGIVGWVLGLILLAAVSGLTQSS